MAMQTSTYGASTPGFQKIESAKNQEDAVKEDIKNLQDLQNKITENIGKAAERLSALRTSVATAFS